jgi:ubiquinone/menaquinone biosynthesis C-methylase UbiE
MSLGFGGEVAGYYARYRRGYPPAAVDAITQTFALTTNDVVMDLGCGTGQLSLPLAKRVRAVVGVDPEPDMLVLARRAAQDQGVTNVAWMLGSDSDLPALQALLDIHTLGAITIAVAVHWMDRDTLFRAAGPLIRPGGGIAVVTNGTPLWLQDTDWSRTVRDCLQRWLGRPLTSSCQTDGAGRQLNRQALQNAGYEVIELSVNYDAELTTDELVGGLFSAMAADQLPSPQGREDLSTQIQNALGHQKSFTEHVQVWLQLGRHIQRS